MQLIPAIDIRGRKCVRLKQGDPKQQTRYHPSPLQMAKTFHEASAEKIHIVDLDGAFSGESQNAAIVQEILREVPIKIEIGGGIRHLDQINFWLAQCVSQVVIGTMAVQHPDLVQEAVQRFGSESIIVGIDAKDGMIVTHGWQNISSQKAIQFAKVMIDYGIKRFIYTDISTDGMFTGPNKEQLAEFARAVKVKITASGGIRDLDDIRSLKSLERNGVDSVIVGRAIYENRLQAGEAIEILKGEAG